MQRLQRMHLQVRRRNVLEARLARRDPRLLLATGAAAIGGGVGIGAKAGFGPELLFVSAVATAVLTAVLQQTLP